MKEELLIFLQLHPETISINDVFMPGKTIADYLRINSLLDERDVELMDRLLSRLSRAPGRIRNLAGHPDSSAAVFIYIKMANIVNRYPEHVERLWLALENCHYLSRYAIRQENISHYYSHRTSGDRCEWHRLLDVQLSYEDLDSRVGAGLEVIEKKLKNYCHYIEHYVMRDKTYPIQDNNIPSIEILKIFIDKDIDWIFSKEDKSRIYRQFLQRASHESERDNGSRKTAIFEHYKKNYIIDKMPVNVKEYLYWLFLEDYSYTNNILNVMSPESKEERDLVYQSLFLTTSSITHSEEVPLLLS